MNVLNHLGHHKIDSHCPLGEEINKVVNVQTQSFCVENEGAPRRSARYLSLEQANEKFPKKQIDHDDSDA